MEALQQSRTGATGTGSPTSTRELSRMVSRLISNPNDSFTFVDQRGVKVQATDASLMEALQQSRTGATGTGSPTSTRELSRMVSRLTKKPK